ncbi:MAG: hypothetical protein EU541_01835 [Promethearchaeota archaeon]|nr:MAG: hypothetical protein EU541_01835 [Candidatus Lokiarchaeota archaeon]
MGQDGSKAESNKFLQILKISPKKVKVRELCSISFHFKLIKAIPHHSNLIFRFRGGRNNKNDWYYIQTEDHNFNGFARLDSEVSLNKIPLLITGKELSLHYFITEKDGIPKDTQMRFSIMNTLAQSIIESEKKIEILLKLPQNYPILLKEIPTLEVFSSKFNHINIISPSIIKKNELFRILVRVEDKYHNLIPHQLNNIKILQVDINTNSKSYLKEKLTIQTNDGVYWIDHLKFSEEGNFYIGIQYKGKIYRSNVIKCVSNQDEHPKLYWGFLHAHTNKSDGVRSIEAYFSNLIKAGLDFGTSTEHDHLWETKNKDFNEIKQIIERINKNDSLTSLFGYEYGTWYSGYGDICIYHRNNDLPILRSDINKYNSTRKLNKNLYPYKGKVLLIGHHTALRPGYRNWDYFDQQLEKLVEIYSTWGNQEYPYSEGNPIPPRYKFFGYGKYARKRGAILGKKGCYVKDALKRGYKLGFTAGGDDHIGAFPSGPLDIDNGIYPSGIMAIWSYKDKLSKEELWNQLLTRKCYGTTGPRVIIQFWLDDFFMGDIIMLEKNEHLEKKRTVKLSIISSNNIEKVELIRNNEIVLEQKIGKKEIKLNFTDKENFNNISLSHSIKEQDFLFYYPRIFLPELNMAWASPIWIIQPNER